MANVRLTTMATHHRPRVVIVGAGFGGLWAARSLARSPVEVLLIDRHNYHCFLPLLYQVAAAELEPEEIAYPVRSILWKLPNVRFVLGDVKGVDLSHRVLETDGPAIPYDFLILATGSVSHFFGVPGASEHAFPLKTLEQGVALRTRILCCFERAALEPDPERRRRLLTFAIVGGGPTGVEFAGALAELIRGPLVKDFSTLDFREVRVVLLEAADGLLVGLPERLRAYAFARLGRMGVEVRLQASRGPGHAGSSASQGWDGHPRGNRGLDCGGAWRLPGPGMGAADSPRGTGRRPAHPSTVGSSRGLRDRRPGICRRRWAATADARACRHATRGRRPPGTSDGRSRARTPCPSTIVIRARWWSSGGTPERFTCGVGPSPASPLGSSGWVCT